MDGVLLQSAEALADPPLFGAGEMWEVLQAEKEHVEHDILSHRILHRDEDLNAAGVEATEESDREIEWHQCERLEDRLRLLNDAQDRLMDGAYGMCLECGKQIETRRLCADPAASLCINCQTRAEGELLVGTL
jgi:RNA polymerase-binding transcription factor